MVNADELLAELTEKWPAYKHSGYWWCKYCKLTRHLYREGGRGSRDPMEDPAQHDVDCIWRRAKEI